MSCLAHYIQDTGEIIGRFSPKLTYPGGIPQPVFELTDEQSEEYDSKGQHHIIQKQDDGTLAFVYVAPPEPTAAELQAHDIAALDAEYEPQFAALAQSLGLATLDGNQTVIDGIKSDYAVLKAEYQTKREAIILG